MSGRLPALVAALVVALAVAVPPWEHTYSTPGAAVSSRPAGHHPVWSPPAPSSARLDRGVAVDATGALLQVLAAAVVAGGLVLAFGRRGD